MRRASGHSGGHAAGGMDDAPTDAGAAGGTGRRRAPFEPEPQAPPHPWLSDARRMAMLARRRASLADIEVLKTRRALEEAAQAVSEAEQALERRIVTVADERRRLREARATDPGGAGALQAWRRADGQLIASIDDDRFALEDARQALARAETALIEALDQQRQRHRRQEKFDLLVEQLAQP